MRLFPCMYLCVCLSPPLPCVQSCCLSTYTHAKTDAFSSLLPLLIEAFSSFCVRHTKWWQRGQLFLAAAHPNKTVSVDAEHLMSAKTLYFLTLHFSQWIINHCFPSSLSPSAFLFSSTISHAGPTHHLSLGKLLQILLPHVEADLGSLKLGTHLCWLVLNAQAVVLWKVFFYLLLVYIRICCLYGFFKHFY